MVRFTFILNIKQTIIGKLFAQVKDSKFGRNLKNGVKSYSSEISHRRARTHTQASTHTLKSKFRYGNGFLGNDRL